MDTHVNKWRRTLGSAYPSSASPYWRALSLRGSAEYALAGHLPILHYRHRTRDIARLGMSQFPLGLMPGGVYVSQCVTYSSRDLFLMLTDGISEVPDDRDEEFGLARVEQLLIEHAEESLPRIWQLIVEQVRRHGPQQDDQTLLLVRIREQSGPGARGRPVRLGVVSDLVSHPGTKPEECL